MRFWLPLLLILPILTTVNGCNARQPRVVLYCAQDKEYAEQILADFTRETGIQVDIRCDTEAAKTVGLYEAIVREKQHPRCDLFWNNEVLNTIRLQQQGLLEPYACPAAESFPAWTRPPERTWQAFAARARILIVNKRVPETERPRTLAALVEPRWKGKVVLAKPLFGTTATHMVCLWSSLGPERAREFLTKLAENAAVLPGNKDVAMAVAEGRFEVGLTDTDDAIIEVQRGRPVEIIFPDQTTMGTLFLPNTLALIKGGPNPAHARKLYDYLLSPHVEAKLAQGPSAQIPLNPQVTVRSPVQPAEKVRALDVDFVQAAKCWEETQAFVREKFAR